VANKVDLDGGVIVAGIKRAERRGERALYICLAM